MLWLCPKERKPNKHDYGMVLAKTFYPLSLKVYNFYTATNIIWMGFVENTLKQKMSGLKLIIIETKQNPALIRFVCDHVYLNLERIFQIYHWYPYDFLSFLLFIRYNLQFFIGLNRAIYKNVVYVNHVSICDSTPNGIYWLLSIWGVCRVSIFVCVYLSLLFITFIELQFYWTSRCRYYSYRYVTQCNIVFSSSLSLFVHSHSLACWCFCSSYYMFFQCYHEIYLWIFFAFCQNSVVPFLRLCAVQAEAFYVKVNQKKACAWAMCVSATINFLR